MNKPSHCFPSLTVCAVPGLHGPDGKPRVEYGPTGQRRSGRDSRPVHFLHEEPGNQTQSSAASIHTAGTHTPHTDLSSWSRASPSVTVCLNSPRHSEVQWRFCSCHLHFLPAVFWEGQCDPRAACLFCLKISISWPVTVSYFVDQLTRGWRAGWGGGGGGVCGFNLCLCVTVSVSQDKCALIWHRTVLHIGILECVCDVFRFRIRPAVSAWGYYVKHRLWKHVIWFFISIHYCLGKCSFWDERCVATRALWENVPLPAF